jgi:hypothetical protein
MELVGRWWNGRWNRRTRRDIWLSRREGWHVRAREGNSESSRELSWDFDDEAEARRMVERLIKADTTGDWREITAAYNRPQDR